MGQEGLQGRGVPRQPRPWSAGQNAVLQSQEFAAILR